jgi:hypothetical protein
MAEANLPITDISVKLYQKILTITDLHQTVEALHLIPFHLV